MVNDLLSMRGDVVIKLNDEVVLEKKNLIVTAGKAFLASAVLNSSTSPFTYMAIGTGTTAAAITDTALATELTRSAFTTSSVASNVVTLTTTYAAGTGTGTLTEAGILNNSSGGTLLSRVVFSAINKGSADSLTITWTITVG
jgi:hypothetical protein|tara:strand:- start:947 stop:1372 length:426 start_codon:yes stop_codon:yes gene_type:complete